KAVAFHSRADFALSGKVTRIALDITDHLNLFGRRNTIIYAQSEELSFADVPLHSAVNGNSVIVDRKVDGLTEGRLLLFAGVDSLTSEPLTDLVGIKKVELTGSLTKITFASVASPAPPKSYVRDSLVIYGNVARSTHGETVSEVLGTGDGSKANQSFKLKQAPALTYTRSTAPGGAESSLQIRVNDLLWHEVPSLFKRGPRERIFTTEMADNGTVTVRFGDGVRGARLPSGAQNVKATYRRGSGLDGLVRAGQLTSLLTRPPGLKSVLNSLAAEGADEPESFANAQQNAPLTVLTLERVVSLEDYENFSRSYAGIAKALATWTWDGRTRGVFLTLAAPLGAAVSNALIADLITAIHASGDPFVPVRAVSYQKALFRITGKIKVDPDYEAEKVLAAANDTLRDAFSFAKRQFGQPVNLSEVIALVQAVAGVVAVDIDSLYRTGATVKLNSRLEAELPHGGDPASLGAAELLTLDPAPIDLKVMP
ncbi:MAG: putative baseplate assembly protein, partial [Verrucomicrobia bacterium]